MGDAGANTVVISDSRLSTNIIKRDTFVDNPVIYSDLLHGNANAGNAPGGQFIAIAVTGGTQTSANAGIVTSNHPGVVKLRSAAGANTGFAYLSDTLTLLLGGGETFEAIFNPTTLTTTLIRMGFIDTISAAAPTDGAYIEIPSTGAAVLRTATNVTNTTSATIATLSTGTWYRAIVQVNSDATSVTGSIYSETGTLLGTQSNSANIPTASPRYTNFGGFVATQSGTGVTDLVHLDYISSSIQGKTLIR